MERAVLFGVMAEISMKAKMLREKVRSDPDSVEQVLAQLERLEDELLGAIGLFCESKSK